MNKKDLWLRLHNYHFNELVPPNLWEKVASKFGGPDASTKAFAHKLAIKLGWDNRFAQWAVSEYKRFVYLGVVSEFVVTPSEIIDQVWHQHILFSKAYRSFCTEIIEYEFDHTPELISAGRQTGIFSAQYLDTLALYEKEFGTCPPAPIWGTPKFEGQALVSANYLSKKKEMVLNSSDGGSGSYYSDRVLYQSFDASAGENFPDFGGGDSGGAGAGGTWDSGDSGSDSSGSDSGSACSSCSSGCGGGD